MTEDKRGEERSRKRIMVRYGEDKPDRTGFTKDFSVHGAFIRTNDVFKPGTTVVVELVFPERTVTLQGRVAWAKEVPTRLARVLECGMGVNFLETPSEWIDFYAKWLACLTS